MTEETTTRPSSRGYGSNPRKGGARASATSDRSTDRPLARVLAAATAALLGVDAYVHLTDASLYDAATTSGFTEGTLFRVEAIVAIVVGIVLLIQPRPLVWAVAAVVAAIAAGAVLLSTYVDAGALGPLPDLYEPTWALPGKPASALAETAAAVLALVGLAVPPRRRCQVRSPRVDPCPPSVGGVVGIGGAIVGHARCLIQHRPGVLSFGRAHSEMVPPKRN